MSRLPEPRASPPKPPSPDPARPRQTPAPPSRSLTGQADPCPGYRTTGRAATEARPAFEGLGGALPRAWAFRGPGTRLSALDNEALS
jgi:hypothetical protein